MEPEIFAFNHEMRNYDRTNAYWLGQAAKLAYADPTTITQTTQSWGFPRCKFFSKQVKFPVVDTQAYTIANDKLIITAFRGTEPNQLKDWLTDAKAITVAGPKGLGRIHFGFNHALNAIYDEVKQTITQFQDNGQTLWFTGHSLGAALTALAARRLQLEDERYFPRGIYTFGQPRTGDTEFATEFDKRLLSVTYRFVNNNDIVTHLPLDHLLNNKAASSFVPAALRGFKHVGQFRYFDAKGVFCEQLSMWDQVKQTISGLIDEQGRFKFDGADDHSMINYVTNLKKCLTA